MDLLIVESPGKVKKIRSFLGAHWNVVASVGHVRDLPSREIGISFSSGSVQLDYRNARGKSDVIARLKSAASKADRIYLAMDPDREGEAIAYHVGMILGKEHWSKISRVSFNEITETAVRHAIHSPRRIDKHLVHSQQARRVVDRLVGFKVSPLLWKEKDCGSSAGRVQSVAVRLVVEREREIRNFTAEEYWKIKANVSPFENEQETFWATLIEWQKKELVSTVDKGKERKQLVLKAEEDALNLLEKLRSGVWVVTDAKKKRRSQKPHPPYVTSSLQQGAHVKFGWNAKKTMNVAQKLYEQGAITYMRTDAPIISNDALKAVREFISGRFGDKYLPPKPHTYKARAKNTQEAHECIRPTDVKREAKDFSGFSSDERKLYELIWMGFVACQMANAEFDVTTIDIKNGEALFRARGKQMLFDGWMKMTSPTAFGGSHADPDAAEDVLLPKVDVHQELKLHELKHSQHFTRPPARYTEASLVRALETFGIGRPSTYASILENIQKRKYIRVEKKKIHAEMVGEKLVDKLLRHFSGFWMEYEFTSQMEEGLDDIAAGKKDWVGMITEFDHDIEAITGPLDVKVQSQKAKPSGIDCPKCGKGLVIRTSKRGEFLGCSSFPRCKHTQNVEATTQPGV